MNTTPKNPYIGPRTFKKDEHHLFFGREREARDLIALTASEQLVLFYAQSGAGKSSLVNTRLIPNFERKDYEVLPVGRVSGDLPAENEVDNIFVCNLIRGLVHHKADPAILSKLTLAQFLAGLNIDDDGYFYDSTPLEELPELEQAGSTIMRRALVIDQFEELLSTHPEAWEKREDFFIQLAQAMREDPYLWVVLVMREDYIAALDPYAHHLPGGLRVRYYMQRLGREAALSAVRSPVEDARPYAKGVAEKLVDDLCSIKVQKPDGTPDVQPGQYVEPVQLQVVCYGLWENLSWENLPPERKQITEKDLQDVGDVNQSLGKHYEGRVGAVADAKKVSQRLIREWFEKKLITAGGIRNMVLQEPNKKSGGLDDEVIEALQSDLVRAEKRGGATWYELTHDRLVEPILERNKEWFNEHLSPLQRQAAIWKDQNENEILLLVDQALVEVKHWAKDHADELIDVETEFLKACEKKQNDKDQQEKLISEQKLARQRRLVTNISIAVTIVMLALAIFAFSQARRAGIEAERATKQTNIALTAQAIAVAKGDESEANRKEAEKQAHFARGNELAVQSQAVFDNKNQLSLLLALESLNEAKQGGASRLPLAEDVLRRAIGQVGIGTLLYGHSARVSAVIISPDGHWLASGSDDYTVRLWDMTSTDPSANPIVLYTDSCQILTLVFSPNGERLAGGCADLTVRLWDMTVENPSDNSKVLTGHSDVVFSLAFSPNGKWLASGSRGAVRLWDMTANDPSTNPIILNGHTGMILTLAFSPNNDWLASGSDDATARLWNMTIPDPSVKPVVLNVDYGAVLTLAFSPNGDWLASGGDDATLRLWRMTTPNPSANPIVIKTENSTIRSLAFSPNGDWLAGGGSDTVLRLWDMNAQDISKSRNDLKGHSDWIRDVAFSATGEWLASASDDSTVRLWNMTARDPSASPIVLRGHSGYIYSLDFSLNGRWLVSAGDDATPRLWDISAQSEILKPEQEIASYEMIASLSGHTKGINALSFSLDGYQLASASDDATVQLWNFQTGLPTEASDVLQSVDGSGPVNTLLSRGSGWFAGTGNNKLLFLSLADGSLFEESYILAGHEGAISVLAVSEGSGLFAVPNNTDYSVELWNGDLEINPLILVDHKDAIQSMMFSPDNRWLASADGDAAIILWDLEDLDAISHTTLKGHTSEVYALAFSPGGRWLASASSDSTIVLWDLSKGAPSRTGYILRGHQGAVRALAFSPGGRWLASAGDDSTIRLWDMFNPSVAPVVLNGDNDSISALTFSPSGRWLVGGGSNTNLHVWGTGIDILTSQACKIANRNFTWQEWREYFKNSQYHTTCVDFPVHSSIADQLLLPGDQSARSGDIEDAIAKYQDALKNCPEDSCPGFRAAYLPDPTARANNQAAQALLDEGDILARNGEAESALVKYKDALKFDPTIIPDGGSPETRADQMILDTLIESISQLNFNASYEELAAKFVEVQIDHSNVVDRIEDATLLNNICWWGSIYGYPSNVKDACEKAVELDPENIWQDSRALNRALLGDYAGAIADFEIAIVRFRESGWDEHYITEREAWIEILKKEQNPFDDPANMEIVRNE